MYFKIALSVGLAMAAIHTGPALANTPLSLKEAINLAREAADPSVEAFRRRAESEEEAAVAARALPDPHVTIGAANLPVDDFSFIREQMTQLQLAARQTFPRGNTLALNSKGRTIRSAEYAASAQAQLDTLIREVSIAWFNVRFSYVAEEELRILYKLLQELSAQQESDFASSGSAALQRIYRTELEQALLEDRLDAVVQDREQAIEGLARYIGRSAAERVPADYTNPNLMILSEPQIQDALELNPVLMRIEQQVQLANNSVALAKEGFKPEFGVEGRFGRRGSDRSDFASVMLSFDVPLFTSKKQAPALRAAKRREQAARLDRDALIRDLTRQALIHVSDITKLHQRVRRFEGTTLERANDAVIASRNAYGAGNIDFAELVRAEITLRDLRLRRAALDRDLNIAKAQLKFIVGEVG